MSLTEKNRNLARIVLSSLEVHPQYTSIAAGNKGDKTIIDVMAGRKFYETKKRMVQDWRILVIRILNLTQNKKLQKSIKGKINTIFGYDVKIQPSEFEIILLKHRMSEVTEHTKESVILVISTLLRRKNIQYSIQKINN